MAGQHVSDSDTQPLAFTEPIPLGADALPLVLLLEEVEARNAARAREAAAS